MERILKVSDFSHYPGGRYIQEGSWSGELYRNTVFGPAIAEGIPVIVDLTELEILLPSFVDESFGPYCQKVGERQFRKNVKFIFPHSNSEAEFFVEQSIQRRMDCKKR